MTRANGNLKNDTFHAYTWDADANSVTLDTSNTLIYDAFDREVEKQSGTTFTQFVFGPTGKLAIMNGQTQSKAFVALPGGTQVKYVGTSISTYRMPDWLGSFRVGSNPNRTFSWGLAFAPFGERYASSGSPAFSFTGEEGTADTVSDEYDFLFRKYHPNQGRWISPDPAGLGAVTLARPQSWNRYAYVENNPLAYIDPDGTSGDDPCGDDPNSCYVSAKGVDAFPESFFSADSPDGQLIYAQLTTAAVNEVAGGAANNGNPQPKSPQRKKCEADAEKKRSSAKRSALASAFKSTAVGVFVGIGVNGAAGCVVGAEVGGIVGLVATPFSAGASDFAGAPVGCVVGGTSAVLTNLTPNLAMSATVATTQYGLDVLSADQVYNQDMQACSQIP